MSLAPVLAATLAAGCSGGVKDGFPEATAVPADLHQIADATPTVEPRSRYGNPASYEVLGEKYFVLGSAEGYKERGRASWYGTKFHGRRTSSGEAYDMFAMTAAHKTLPLPTYVRVTHLGNRKSVVVKVNDRGPFHQGRIIDLSYAAAAKLEILGQGSAEVEVEALDPEVPPARASSFLELGSTDDPIYAVALREEAAGLGVAPVQIRTLERSEGTWHRVLAGPFHDEASLNAARQRLEGAALGAKPVEE